MQHGGEAGTRLGFVWLQPGFTRRNGLTLVYAALTGIPLLAFLNFIQPIILENVLGIAKDVQAPVTANLAVAQELIVLTLVSPLGALSDRIGRPRVLLFGYLVVAAGFLAYPFATSVLMLTAIRAGYAIGAAAIIAAYSAALAEQPQERSRGKLVAALGVLNGLGIGLLGFVGGSLPGWLEAAGFSPLGASRIAMTSVALLAALSGVVCAAGLAGGPARDDGAHARQPLIRLLREGLGAARNPRIAVAYAAAFAARGDVVVIGTYLSLWVVQAGTAQGLTPAEAQGRAGIEFAIVTTAALLAAPLLGIFNDRVNRVTALATGMGFAALGYIVFGAQDDPLARFAFIAAALLGAGQMSSILAGQTLISQEADPRITGSIIGVFSFFGGVGTLAGSWIGGQLFGLWRPGAPFLLMGGFNLIVAIAAVWVRIIAPGDTLAPGAVRDDLLASAAAAED